MSMNFQNIEVRTALQIVADFTGLNIITSDSVTGALTLKLHKVPWDQVLDIMAQAKGLSVRRQGNVIWVAPRAEVAAREKLEYESKLAAQNLEPMQTRGFALNYAKAVDVLTQIQGGTVLPAMSTVGGGYGAGYGGFGSAGLGYAPPINSAPFSLSSMGGGSRILSTRGSAMAEARTNQLFVTDIPSKLEQVQALIANQVVRHRLVDMAMRINAVKSTLELLAYRVGQGEKPVAEICMLKNLATSTMEFCANEAMQVFGGAGYLRGSPQIAKDLAWAGVDCVSVAMNHSLDWGPQGMLATIKHCNEAGIATAGTGQNLEVANAPAYFENDKGRISLISLASGNSAFEWAGYEVNHEWGEGGHNRKHGNAIFPGSHAPLIAAMGAMGALSTAFFAFRILGETFELRPLKGAMWLYSEWTWTSVCMLLSMSLIYRFAMSREPVAWRAAWRSTLSVKSIRS